MTQLSMMEAFFPFSPAKLLTSVVHIALEMTKKSSIIIIIQLAPEEALLSRRWLCRWRSSGTRSHCTVQSLMSKVGWVDGVLTGAETRENDFKTMPLISEGKITTVCTQYCLRTNVWVLSWRLKKVGVRRH